MNRVSISTVIEMQKLNPQFFEFRGAAANGLPEIKEIHWYEDGLPLPVPQIEISGIRKNWPVCIPPFYAHEPFALRSDAVRTIEEAGLTGLVTKETKIRRLNGKKGIDREVPDYCLVGASVVMPVTVEVYETMTNDGRISGYKFLFAAEDMKDPRIAEIQGRREYGRHSYRHVPPLHWSAPDFFNIGSKKFFGAIHCTLPFVELAREQRWGNIYFQPLDGLGDAAKEYRSRPWPPSEWYSESQRRLYS